MRAECSLLPCILHQHTDTHAKTPASHAAAARHGGCRHCAGAAAVATTPDASSPPRVLCDLHFSDPGAERQFQELLTLRNARLEKQVAEAEGWARRRREEAAARASAPPAVPACLPHRPPPAACPSCPAPPAPPAGPPAPFASILHPTHAPAVSLRSRGHLVPCAAADASGAPVANRCPPGHGVPLHLFAGPVGPSAAARVPEVRAWGWQGS